MREILFRGKRIDNGDWVEGSLLVWLDGDAEICTPRSDPMCEEMTKVIVDRETVGQFTGLTDKNGKKIFEGDIVHYLYQPGKGYWNCDQNSVIEWDSTGFYMRGIMGTNKYACSHGWLVSIPHGGGAYFEVIGNIHDNPELLGGGGDA